MPAWSRVHFPRQAVVRGRPHTLPTWQGASSKITPLVPQNRQIRLIWEPLATLSPSPTSVPSDKAGGQSAEGV